MTIEYGNPGKPGDAVAIWKHGRRVARSRNLRGILDYARRHSTVAHAIVRAAPHGANVYFHFYNGAECWAAFADYSVARGWIPARRSWGLTCGYTGPELECWQSELPS